MLIPLEQQVARLQEEVRQLRLLLGVEEGDFELVRTPRSSQLHRSPEPGPSSEARRPIETTVPSQAEGLPVYPLPGRGPPSSVARPVVEETSFPPRSERDAACREIGLWW